MEEVVSIIIDFLKKIDSDIPKVQKISELPVNVIVESAAKCLKSINPSLKVSTKCPEGISQRIEVAAQIATMCKEMGYKNELGYQTFLYCNEADLRQVFMFLVEHLPNEDYQTSVVEGVKSRNNIMFKIAIAIEEELNRIWVPKSCYMNNNHSTNENSVLLRDSTIAAVNQDDLIKKLLQAKQSKIRVGQEQHNNQEIGMSSNTEITEKPNLQLEIKESLKDLKANVLNLKQKFNTLESDNNLMDFEFLQNQKKLKSAEAELANVVAILESIGINNPTVENTENVLEKVQNNISQLHIKSENINTKIFEVRQEIERLKKEHSLVNSERNECKNILSSLKQTAKSLKEEYETKSDKNIQLQKNYERVKGGNKRSIYTKRILEIISNVDKQNLEISKVLEDTRELQKEINSLEGQLDRCFSIADELLFKNATKDDDAKKSYKLLALLHSECNTIVSLINDTGTIAREMIDLEDNVKTEKAKKSEDLILRIQEDLSRLHQEQNN